MTFPAFKDWLRDRRNAKKPGLITIPGRRRRSDRAIAQPTPGVCRYCGCTDEQGCILGYDSTAVFDGLAEHARPLTCSWLDAAHTVCSKATCVQLYRREISA